eukprot:CAMPEP_0170510320 /NCGR_PEP_ID=MMETSP0208-20121228/65698_1 /TAXON_ID=197538 /ORGANISM="Strombidium inclinatum, Strain S3" /LENGTH=327 /DNA_ID=CAMNT_0010793771 /DNA_START=631 /DNA_END=1614 /DNA_ORIENTATION=-
MSSPIKRDVINTQISALLPEGTQDSPISTNARVLKNLKAAFSSFSPDAQTVKIQTQADLQPVPMMKALTFKSKGLSLRSTTSKPNSVCDYKSDTKDPWNRPLVEQQKQQARNLMVTLNRGPDAQTVKIQTQADLQPVPMMKALTFKSKGLSLRSTTSKPNSVCDYKSDTKDPWNRPLVEQQKQQARNLMVTLNREVSKLEREQSREKKRRLATEFSLNYGSKFEEEIINRGQAIKMDRAARRIQKWFRFKKSKVEIINRGQAIKMDRAARRIQKWFRFKKSKVNLVLKLRSIVLAVVRLQKMNKTWAFKKNLANRILYRRNTASFVV